MGKTLCYDTLVNVSNFQTKCRKVLTLTAYTAVKKLNWKLISFASIKQEDIKC